MEQPTPSTSPTPENVAAHYTAKPEEFLLDSRTGKLEKKRLQDFMQRILPPSPAVVLDVGGGPGLHAFWLASRGYQVHLIDIVPYHIEQAEKAADAQPGAPLASASVGDARSLKAADASVDAVLLFGPLYHLTERRDRMKCFAEAYRVLKPGGILMAIGISRFVYALDGLFRGFLDDPEFIPLVDRDLQDGQHSNPTGNPDYFTEAFFHTAEELKTEVRGGGFKLQGCFGIEGPGWLLPNFNDHWNDDGRRNRLLKMVNALESEPSLYGLSAHLMAVGKKS